jgi:putative PIN family toxin of toxin-antitoxin system
MMRIVCDTNVLLSAYLFRNGTFAWLREAVDAVRFTLVFDRRTTAELLRVLAYDKFALTKSERDSVLLRLMLHAQAHLPAKTGSASRSVPKCRDPQDQMFIDLAYAAGVDALVTGDKDLIALASSSAVPILTPQQLRARRG